ncbi:hypothetical protein FR932_13465 [Moritella marina ATCC 15381]|uniref:Uncharacterized protein n=1 Tax=Moritella marina ATCC 15381 TaxID=1202962 RepID=A0A5J6WKT9_MORMI|nr:hypothetical protein [Moritella marina]QFI38786.1 hypothetical protein FR932_13465 [Moritella marina ATCC 15381]
MHFFTLKNSAILSVTATLYLAACTHTAQASNVVKTVTNGALTPRVYGQWCGLWRCDARSTR